MATALAAPTSTQFDRSALDQLMKACERDGVNE
jgi:hypothetical protein